jgi:hypothetical protein
MCISVVHPFATDINSLVVSSTEPSKEDSSDATNAKVKTIFYLMSHGT